MQSMSAQEVRDMMAQAPAPELDIEFAKVEERTIPVDQDEIKIRIYTPEGEGPFPIIVYYHGGGWVLGDLETADGSCHILANKTGHVVVSVDYRLAPEYKFPVPFNDAYDALKWVAENADSINGDASKISVSGDSAGGNLAAAVSLRARDENGPKIHAQLLVYPVTDVSYDTDSYEQFKDGFGLDKDLMKWFGDYYINSEEDAKNPYVAPLVADDLSNLPPAIVITAEFDVLRDEGIAYAERLKEAGVKVEQYTEEGLVHAFFTTVPVFKDRIFGTVEKIDTFLKSLTPVRK